jgi:hypothetical protein
MTAPFALEVGDRLAPMAAEFVDCLFRWQFVASSMAWVLLTLVLCDMSVCIISLHRSTYVPFRRLSGDVRREFLQRLYAALFMVLWVHIFAMLCMRAVLMLWHAFLFLGLRFPPLFFFLLYG